MKTDIHPTYFPKAIVTCSCGAKHTVGSTVEKMTVEICSKCHPFYTGKEKLVDTAGRVERFEARRAKFSAQGARLPDGQGSTSGGKSRLKTADDKKTAAKTKKAAAKSAKEGKTKTAKKSPKKKIVKTTKRPSVRSKTSAKTKK